MNKTLKDTLKKRLEEAKGAWAEELHEVLWSYRTTARTATGHTPFSLAYGYEAMLPVDCVFGQLTRSRNERKSKSNKCVLNRNE